jgi:hypothetical protein
MTSILLISITHNVLQFQGTTFESWDPFAESVEISTLCNTSWITLVHTCYCWEVTIPKCRPKLCNLYFLRTMVCLSSPALLSWTGLAHYLSSSTTGSIYFQKVNDLRLASFQQANLGTDWFWEESRNVKACFQDSVWVKVATAEMTNKLQRKVQLVAQV